MQRKRLQNKIAESRWLLAFVVPPMFALWAFMAYFDHSILLPTFCLLFSNYLMMELNNANALIRIYSRMVSATFLILSSIAIFQFSSLALSIVTLCCIGYYTCLFRCYQDPNSQGWVFYAFLCVGLSSIVWVQALYFVPFLWIFLRTNLLAFNFKSWVSSLLGLLVPYVFYTAYLVYRQSFDRLIAHFTRLGEFSGLADYTCLSVAQLLYFSFIFLCAFIGTTHFLRQQRNDSIRTRLFYGVFMTINTLAIIFLILQPQHFIPLIGVITVSTSPLIAHFFALTHTRGTNIVFKIITLSALALLAYNLWIFLTNFF
ncbi:MAG: hypothetical protein SOZ07_04050 [Prevotella sp.]|nr:hypothetical protein [Prevotellaceae bacterium]MDY3935816.1 hypothetical protein [Prevotella sp.]